MSSKATIKSRQRRGEQPGYHLYEDVLDSLGADDSAGAPVYLRLDGVTVELQTLEHGGATVTLAFPRELARELGQLPPGTVSKQ